VTHKNREKRAAKKERETLKAGADYEEGFEDEDYDDDEGEPVRRRGLHPGLIALVIVVVIAAGALFTLNMAYDNAVQPTDPGNTDAITASIPAGASTAAIAAILKENGLIGNELFFKVHCRRMGYDGQFKHGDYALNKSMTADEIADALIKGTLAQTKSFTIPEGYNIIQIARSLAEQGIVSEADFYDEAQNGSFGYAFLADCPPGSERLEGFLYPETYEVYADATAHDVVGKMLAQFDALFKPEYYARAQEMGMGVRDIVTMGSIIERESVAAEERPLMAGVFYNRLGQGMRLESCATIQYILGEPKEFLTIADTQIESPYNTYLHEGLPPGPICSPRMASIEAALYPDDNDFVFFVLSDGLDGTHKFSADYDEFLRNKDAYYAAVENVS
jgi:UPF0755 protein